MSGFAEIGNVMKHTFKLFQICLLICGVIGAEADEVKTVSVMEGDSITLSPDLTQTPGVILMLWRFEDEGSTIAQIDGKEISYPYLTEIFRGRLQLDLTGSLTIKNMRIKHSGLYKLQIDHSTGTSRMTFSVTVFESPSVIGGGEAGMKSVSVAEGDLVTLQTDVTKTHGDELIVWRFGDERKLIVKRDIEAKNSYETDERFRDRLKLDQTGSLTITHTRTTDSGLYTVKISSSSSKQTIFKRFSVTVGGSVLSSGAVAGIVVLLLVFAGVAAAGVIYYRRKISELKGKKLSVKEGGSVTLNTDAPEVQTYDQIEWRFGNGGPLIAQIKGRIIKIYEDVLDGRFRNRLKLNKKTGSLTIKNIRNTDAGLYDLKISRDGEIQYKKFSVSVCAREICVREEEPLTLNTNTEIQRDDQILWMCGENLIAQIKGGKRDMFEVPERFRDRLELDEKTGSLTIKNMRNELSGLYKLQIINSRENTVKRFFVTVWEKKVSVYEGDPVTLVTYTEIHSEDQIQWMFVEKNTEINGGIREITCDGADGRFKDRLELDETTGSLTIRNTRKTDSGLYKLQIESSRGISYRKIWVNVRVRMISVEKGNLVTLETNVEIQRDDQILWKFEDAVIVQITGKTRGKTDDAKERFKERLELDDTTGSLTIKNMRAEHFGIYKLQIINSRGTLDKTFKVVVVNNGYETMTVIAGEDVPLPSSTFIEVDEIVHWLFNDETIAIGMNKDINLTSYPFERFRNRLQLDHQTGSLTIKNTRTSDTGKYHLKLLRSGIERKFTVTVSEREIPVEEGEPLTLNPDTDIQRDDLILWMCGGNLIAQIKGGKRETFDDVASERFRGRLKLDEKTGSLTITNMRDELSGLYKLYIISSRGNTDKRFFVTLSARDICVREEESLTLTTNTDIQRDDQILWMCGENLIAQIKEGKRETFDDVPGGRFRGRLKLDEKTGSLTITDIRIEESGCYKLHIINSRGNTDKRFSVDVWVSNRKAPPLPSSVKAESNVNDTATVVMPLLSDMDVPQETSSL
ncbi:muscle M-line assembly protein unc-89-like [Pseudorasbora parva]|uniref:muscle M-line assembly protein unc-89-like n=1 Tax=Pseudorasbora parva TaxID=51549 RepID=UPI00351E4C8D